MQLQDWVFIGLFLLGIIFSIGGIIWILGDVLQEFFENKNLNGFEDDFKNAVEFSQPDWSEIKEIASTRGLTHSKILFIIRKFYREILTGRDKELLEHKNLIRSYIDQYRTDEPFEGLPNEIRIHLEKLREQLNGEEQYIEPLTGQIKELLKIYEKDKKQQRFYTAGGFFIAIISLLFAGYTSFLQPKTDSQIPDGVPAVSAESNIDTVQ
ncbi:hypothetical protein [Psychrobacter fozii]|uniref:hypothetical protein n=1 Tax=Psychrobacter fozii TaxID=198480 RepID=UPI00191872BA|nr:hypothetical protein [Psychrobacter fozii]